MDSSPGQTHANNGLTDLSQDQIPTRVMRADVELQPGAELRNLHLKCVMAFSSHFTEDATLECSIIPEPGIGIAACGVSSGLRRALEELEGRLTHPI